MNTPHKYHYLSMLGIVACSFFWVFAIGNIYVLDGYFLLEFLPPLSNLTEAIVISGSLILPIGAALYFSWKWFKNVTEDYLYHYTHWAIVMILFSLPFFYDRGWSLLFVGIYIGAPILFINYIANVFHMYSKTAHLRVSLIGLAIVLGLGGTAELMSNHSAFYRTKDFDFEIRAYTSISFLDWSGDMELTITDRATGKYYVFENSFGDGPILKVSQGIEDKHLLILGDANWDENLVVNMHTGVSFEPFMAAELPEYEEILFHDPSSKFR